MKKLAVLGMGHIGKYVYDTLKTDSRFSVAGYDLHLGHNLSDEDLLHDIIKQYDGVLASTPFFLNKKIAQICNEYETDYFDLTESVEVTEYVKTLTNARFVTQCGLAPGMVNIIANRMAREYHTVRDIEIRVGALPLNANNLMGYFRTWSTEGLINEYIHECPAVKNGKLVTLEPLTGHETVNMNGVLLEARTTSGGIGSLAESWAGRAQNVNYKTLRYLGHWTLMEFLKNDLGLAKHVDEFTKIFNGNIPTTYQDCVYILIRVSGMKHDENEYSTNIYTNVVMYKDNITAIQLTTGNGVMAVLDSWQQGTMDAMTGWVRVEDIDYRSVWDSKYSECYWQL